jgi:hypothetical protein
MKAPRLKLDLKLLIIGPLRRIEEAIMYSKYPLILSLTVIIYSIFTFSGCTPEKQGDAEKAATTFPDISGPYLGQEPPGMEAKLFAPGIVSTGMNELNSVFFPDGKELIFSVAYGEMKWALIMMREENGQWTRPEVAPFSGVYSDVDPFVSFDGNRIYYCSNRPLSGEGAQKEDFDIWYVNRTKTGWSAPVNMGAPINSNEHEFYPCITKSGNFYFQSRRRGGPGAPDIFMAEMVDGKYEQAAPLSDTVNSAGFEGDTFVAPDESFLIVSTVREDAVGGRSPDLYISFRNENGAWTPLKNMGERVNSEGGENCQILSPCGNYLFFTGRRFVFAPSSKSVTYQQIMDVWKGPQNGYGDIYWINASVIQELKSSQ